MSRARVPVCSPLSVLSTNLLGVPFFVFSPWTPSYVSRSSLGGWQGSSWSTLVSGSPTLFLCAPKVMSLVTGDFNSLFFWRSGLKSLPDPRCQGRVIVATVDRPGPAVSSIQVSDPVSGTSPRRTRNQTFPRRCAVVGTSTPGTRSVVVINSAQWFVTLRGEIASGRGPSCTTPRVFNYTIDCESNWFPLSRLYYSTESTGIYSTF